MRTGVSADYLEDAVTIAGWQVKAGKIPSVTEWIEGEKPKAPHDPAGNII